MASVPARKFAAGILAILVAVAIWLVLRSERVEPPAPTGGTAAPAGAPARPGPGSPAPGPGTASKSAARPAPPAESAAESIEEHFESLSAARTPESARQSLAALESWLKDLDPEQAAAVVRGFLQSGRDASLPFEFAIGENGFLESPPSVRVALLDFLGRFHPDAGAALGKEILSAPTTADEWAVALRNVARFDDDGSDRAYLRAKTEELIRNDAWQERPSIGYLNAFDVLVHTGATESAPLLFDLIQRKDRRDLAHASFLTLDRLTQRQPIEVLGQLKDDGALQASRPEMVAQQFARADLREPAQRDLVRAWLLDPSRSPEELRAFAGIFPNNNKMISKNLLTSETPPTGTDLRDHDVAVLAVVNQWQEDPAFEKVRPQLETMAQRLRQFTGRTPAPPGP